MMRLVAVLAATVFAAGTVPPHGSRRQARPPAPPSLYVEDLTWPEVRDAIQQGRSTALIYTGSTEQNGPHMAIGKHNVIAHYAAGQIAEQLGDALVYPTLPFAPAGDPQAKTGHMAFPGSVSLTPETFAAVVRQVALSAIAAGFRQVYLMGDHGGGQHELRRVAERLQREVRARGVRVRYVSDVYYKATEEANAYLKAHHLVVGSHAGAYDTSELMALDSTNRWIRRDRLAASDSTKWSVTGVAGDPTTATPEMGRIFLQDKLRDAVAQIRRLRAEPL
jgi:creatinine amidohydrolase